MSADDKNSKGSDRIQTKPGQLPVNQETLDILVANIIPTSKYFEARFDHLEHRVIRIEDDIKDFRQDMDDRFNQVKIDTDKRFEQVDKRFEQIIHSIDRLSDNLDKRDSVQRSVTMRMFSISIMISFLGVLGVALKLFGV